MHIVNQCAAESHGGYAPNQITVHKKDRASVAPLCCCRKSTACCLGTPPPWPAPSSSSATSVIPACTTCCQKTLCWPLSYLQKSRKSQTDCFVPRNLQERRARAHLAARSGRKLLKPSAGPAATACSRNARNAASGLLYCLRCHMCLGGKGTPLSLQIECARSQRMAS